jgi:hypothetical protein
MNNFRLQPFTIDSDLPDIEIVGEIDRDDRNILSIEYQVQGDLNAVAIAPLNSLPSRKFELWESTCFEFFIGVPGNSNYWEFNLSPTGDWNVFALDNYRQGLRNEIAFTSLPIAIDRQANTLLLKLTVDLTNIISLDRNLEVSVTTVIKSTEDKISYWALTHTGTEADFHRRDSFIINI